MDPKGLVFDHTPGQERAGLVPRVKLMDKSGLLNPIFVSAGERAFGDAYLCCSFAVLYPFFFPVFWGR
jgi:hypothetical protein